MSREGRERPTYEQWKALMDRRPIHPTTRKLWMEMRYAKQERAA